MTKVEKAFQGASLRLGLEHLVQPTYEQSAYLARTNPTAVRWAARRWELREAIIAGDLPLVPPRNNKAASHEPIMAGELPSVPAQTLNGARLSDCVVAEVIADLISKVGTDKFLAIAAAVESGISLIA